MLANRRGRGPLVGLAGLGLRGVPVSQVGEQLLPWALFGFVVMAISGALLFYSGPVKAKVAFVKEVAYTTAQAEENDLQAGKLSIGFVDPGVLTSPAPAPGKVGPI